MNTRQRANDKQNTHAHDLLVFTTTISFGLACIDGRDGNGGDGMDQDRRAATRDAREPRDWRREQRAGSKAERGPCLRERVRADGAHAYASNSEAEAHPITSSSAP